MSALGPLASLALPAMRMGADLKQYLAIFAILLGASTINAAAQT